VGAQTPDGSPVPDGPDLAPPPTPFERQVVPAVRRRGPASAVLVLLGVVVGVLGGVLLGGVLELPDAVRGTRSASGQAELDAELVALLTDVTRTEGVMLAFNATLEERLGEAVDEPAAFAVIARAAAEGAGGLAALRPVVVARSGGRVDEVRDAYLPHLDAWLDYLSALADEPALLFAREGQQPYILLINVTAESFRDALEALLADDPSPPVGELAERILDDGFRGEGPPPNA
jgi:hypothetical protein